MKKNNQNQFFQGWPSNLIVLMLIMLFGLAGLAKLTDWIKPTAVMNYSEFIKAVQDNKVADVHVVGQDVTGHLSDGTFFETTVLNNPADIELLKEHNVVISTASSAGQTSLLYLSLLFMIGLMVAGIAWFFIRQRSGGAANNGNNNIFSVGKSRARMYMPSAIKENFNSVAGAVEAKEELQDIVEFLKNPEKFSRLGAKITRGVLLEGEPGNGKTLLAKAVAGEANCPFFSISGSDFIEVFVGVGASRVRDLFAQARKHAPCIIFIDEIDAVGRQRGTGLGGGHDEREQTLNQLLTEMDGFQTVGGAVIVLAATNRPDVLDKALLRPGRFDRHVTVPYPDLKSREQILRLHAKDVVLDSTIDLATVAGRTPGFTGADLANLINEAALIAAKNPEQKMVTLHDLEEALDKIRMGKRWQTAVLSEDEKRLVAYHEAGHTLTRVLLKDHADPIHKVTILPRGRSLGSTHFMPEKERFTESKERKIASIISALGGRAAEEVEFNTQDSGAGSDFAVATNIARNMVCVLGMSKELGPVIYTQGQGYEYSEKTAEKIDTEVQRILDECMSQAKQLLVEHKDKLDALATALLTQETLDAHEVYAIVGIAQPDTAAGETDHAVNHVH